MTNAVRRIPTGDVEGPLAGVWAGAIPHPAVLFAHLVPKKNTSGMHGFVYPSGFFSGRAERTSDFHCSKIRAAASFKSLPRSDFDRLGRAMDAGRGHMVGPRTDVSELHPDILSRECLRLAGRRSQRLVRNASSRSRGRAELRLSFRQIRCYSA